MLHFSDEPYEFFPPRTNRFLIWIGRHLNRWFILPGRNHRLTGVEVIGRENFEKVRRERGARVCFIANHPTHSDPQVMVEVQRQIGATSCFMAAYDVFLRGKCVAWVMQRVGAFSVDRDGNDRASMKTAIDILKRGQYALTVFPEGNVYLMNDWTSGFQEGAAFLALKAQKDAGESAAVYVVPVSIKLTHEDEVREGVRERLGRLAADFGMELRADGDFLEDVKRVGVAALEKTLHRRGLMPEKLHRSGGDLRELLVDCAEHIVAGLEKKMELPAKDGMEVNDRIRRIRSRVHEIRMDPAQKAVHRVAVSWADEAMTALQVLSYSGAYLNDSPSLDRVAESVCKILEDVYSEIEPPLGSRRALVHVGEAIDLRSLDAKKTREAVRELTARMEGAVQAGVDAANTRNECPGGKPW